MNIKKVLISLAIILLVWAIVFLLIRLTLTGQVVRDYKTYTKAVCDKNNFCQDYEIVCENKEVVNITPISGAIIQHSDSWEDPRINKSQITCE